MSLKNIIKVANYYNVKYSFGSEERNKKAKLTNAELVDIDTIKGKSAIFKIEAKFSGLFEGAPFELYDNLDLTIVDDKEEGPMWKWDPSDSDFNTGEDKKFKLFLNGEKIDSDYSNYYDIIEDPSLSKEIENGWESLKDTILDNEYISGALSDYGYDAERAREDSVDPYGVRGLSRKDFY
jgi:hypothetical protein